MAVATFDLPTSLAAFINRLPKHLDIQPEDIAWHHTMYPYFAAAGHSERKAAALKAMITGEGDVHMTLGLTAFKVRPIKRLRFCASCNRENFAEYGEVWWSRIFHLPGVLVCPVHGEPLRASTIDLDSTKRHEFVPANTENCSENAPLICQPNREQIEILSNIAQTSGGFLKRREAPVRDLEEFRHAYLERCRLIGLMKSEKKVDLVGLHKAFLTYWKPVSDLLEKDTGADLMSDLGWLDALLRKQRKASHPFQHILLSIFLEQHAELSPQERHPFGIGPWECRNPAALHYGAKVVEQLRTYNNKGSLVASFSCTCGYKYTRGVNRHGAIGPPRFKEGGPLLTGLLRDSAKKGDSIRSIARRTGLDSKTLVRIMKNAGIPVDSIMAANASEETPKPKPDLPSPVRKKQSPKRKTRVDWVALDKSMAGDVEPIAVKMRHETPPRRLAFAALELELCSRGYVLKRRTKLPLTYAAICDFSESKDAFRVRRYKWWEEELSSTGIPAPDWKIVREAGIRKELFQENLAGALEQ